jgi:hypothetical protein
LFFTTQILTECLQGGFHLVIPCGTGNRL